MSQDWQYTRDRPPQYKEHTHNYSEFVSELDSAKCDSRQDFEAHMQQLTQKYYPYLFYVCR